MSSLIFRELEDFFVPLLHNCSNISELEKIHARIIKHSLSQSSFLVTKMVDVCDRTGDTGYAKLLFDRVIEPNVFLYNSTIRAFTHNSVFGEAMAVYKRMLRFQQSKNPNFPDRFTFPFVIKSCAGLNFQSLGKQVHGHLCKFGPRFHVVTENALIDMYTKCDNLMDAHKVFGEMAERDVISWNSLISGNARLGQMKKARFLFDQMTHKTIVSWTAMISGYTRLGCYADALDIFHRMQLMGLEPDEISIVSVLPSCAHLGALELGKWIHMYSDRKGLLKQTGVCNALMEMYAKCGMIDQAIRLFDKMDKRDVISWSTVLSGFANHGLAREAIGLFKEMQRANVNPNGITFLGLLSACAHGGLWEEGLLYFDTMRKDYHLEPEIEHYGCLIDILGRAGQLNQAVDVISKMPMKPDAKIWGSLLSCCRTHGNLEVACIAMQHLLEFEPDDTGNYVLLSNIYAYLGMWEDVSRMRKLIRSKSMKKVPGCSLIEVNNVVEEFVAGDDSKPFWNEICLMLELLSLHHNRTRNCDLSEIMGESSNEHFCFGNSNIL